MAESPIVRRARSDEAEQLSKLGVAGFVATFGHLYRAEDLEAFLNEAHSVATVARDLAKQEIVYFVAEDGSELVGYAKLTLAVGWPEYARGRKAFELKQLYVSPGSNGRGIGAALIERVIEQARAHGADEIQLSVWQGNHGAQRFYKRYGFEQRAEIEFRVGQQIDDEFLFAALI